MPKRKFYYRDKVIITSGYRYVAHAGHHGEITKTRINSKDNGRWPRVVYEVECECGKALHMESKFMDLVARPWEDGYLSIAKRRMSNFLKLFPEVGANDGGVQLALTLEERVAVLLSPLNKRDQYILIQRHGLEGDSGKPFTDIGKVLGISRERVRQLHERAMEKLYEN